MSDAPVSQHDYVSNRLSSLATSNDVTLADSWPLENSQEIPQCATLKCLSGRKASAYALDIRIVVSSTILKTR